MFVYLWGVWGFHSQYTPWEPLGIKIMYEYVLYVYQKTFTYDGAIGGFFEDDNPATQKDTLARYFYDGIYNFFILMLIFEIV